LINGFITALTAFCHYTFSIYHYTFCASLRIKKCPGAAVMPHGTASHCQKVTVTPSVCCRKDFC